MRESIEKLCRQFTEAQNIIAEAEPLQSRFAYPICAEMFVERGMVPKVKKLRECDHILIKEAGLFSDFSGMAALMIVSYLSMTEDPLKTFGELDKARKILRNYFPRANEYVSMASMVLVQVPDAAQWDRIAAEARRNYDSLKKRHRILTSGGDIVFSVILARFSLKLDEVSERAVKANKILSDNGFDAQSLLSLSRVLALSEGTPEENCSRFTELYRTLRDGGYKYGREYQLPVLGLAAVLPGPVSDIAADIRDADRYLSGQTLYRGVIPTYSKTVRLMHAALIVSGQAPLLRPEDSDGPAHIHQNALIAMEVTIWTLFDILFI